MNTSGPYRLYIEPYCFIFQEKEEAVIYNYLNGAYLHIKDSPLLQQAIHELNAPDNGYNTVIPEKFMENSDFNRFIEDIKASYSGDIIPVSDLPQKPFLFFPEVSIREKMSDFEKAYSFAGKELLKNINEATIYLPAPCNYGCKGCKQYDKQFGHCSDFQKLNSLHIAEYAVLFAEFQAAGVARVNFMGGDLTVYEQREELLTVLKNYDFKKEFYFDIRQLSPVCHTFLRDETFGMTVWVHPPYEPETLLHRKEQFEKEITEWRVIVESEQDLEQVELLFPEEEKLSIHPFYNSANYSFFEKYVFYDLSDLLAEPIDKKTIFRRQVLNENYFGKIYLSPEGDLYTHPNLPPVGNIREKTLTEMVFQEMKTPYAWMKIRDEAPCKTCVNKFLCPSPGNYETVFKRPNLCHIKR